MKRQRLRLDITSLRMRGYPGGTLARQLSGGWSVIGVSIEGFDLVPVVLGGHEDAGSLGQRSHDLAG